VIQLNLQESYGGKVNKHIKQSGNPVVIDPRYS